MNQFSPLDLATYASQPLALTVPLEKIVAWEHNSDLLRNIHVAAQQLLDPIAIDKGYYPIKEMGELAKLGAFATHLTSQGNRFMTLVSKQLSVRMLDAMECSVK